MSATRSLVRLSIQFLKRGRRYLILLLFTLLVVTLANGAKALQIALIQPVLDHFSQEEAPSQSPVKQTTWLKEKMHSLMEIFPSTDRSLGFLRNIAILAIILSVLMFVLGCLKDYFTNYVTKRITADIRSEVIEHMTYLPLRHFHERKAGDLVSRITNDINAMEPAANFFFDDLFVQPTTILWAVTLILLTNPILALATVAVFSLYVFPLVKLGKAVRRLRRQSLESLGDMTQTMLQTLGGIKVVKAFNMESAQVQDFNAHNERSFKKIMHAIRQRAIGENLSQLFIGGAVTIMLVGGGFLLARKHMTPGDLAQFAIYVAMINSAVRELAKSYNHLLEASTGCDRVFEILNLPRETSHESGEELTDVAPGVEFRGVCFAYDTEPVLSGISLRVVPGEVVALVGRSGAGKTTLCDLLCRFYDPRQGEITIGGKDIRRLRRSNLLRHIAVVGQDTFLFNASIGENIRYSRSDASQPDVEAAAQAANIHSFILTLPKGYDTVVGERGAKLSGGQRQRVAIARAVLKNPGILILDEATSSLDTENEKLVQQALAELIRSNRHRITLVIAHRLSTVRDADRIVVLEEGRIVEVGKHEELLAKEGVYTSLYQTQFST